MTQFGTAEQLATLLDDEIDTARADQVLTMVADRIRAATGQQLDRVTDDVVTLTDTGRASSLLYLPQLPVVDVTLVERLTFGTLVWFPLVELADYVWSSDGVIQRARWPRQWQAPSTVRVTYAHGYDPIPGDVIGVALGAAARLYGNPRLLGQEGFGAHSVAFGPAAAGVLSDDDLSVLSRYTVARV